MVSLGNKKQSSFIIVFKCFFYHSNDKASNEQNGEIYM